MEGAREALFSGGLGKKRLGEALFGFACLRRNACGDDSKTFPNAGPVAPCPRCAQGGDDF